MTWLRNILKGSVASGVVVGAATVASRIVRDARLARGRGRRMREAVFGRHAHEVSDVHGATGTQGDVGTAAGHQEERRSGKERRGGRDRRVDQDRRAHIERRTGIDRRQTAT